MRKLMVVVLVLAGLWGSYWFIGSRATETAFRAWLDARAAEGWVAEYSDVSTTGFPNRFDTTLSDLELADPETGVAWSAPFFQILSLSYQPNHVIAAFPAEQTVASPNERVTVRSDEMRGSVVVEPGTALVLDRSTFVLSGIEMQSTAGWTARIDEGRLATRQTEGQENFHDIGFEANRLRPAEPILATLDPAGLLPDEIETMRIDATLGFDAPWDRFAIERARPGITRVDLREVHASWGEMDLRVAGALDVDRAGVPTGQITVRAENWREMLAVARRAGVVPPAFEGTVAGVLEMLAGLSGQPETIDAPLNFRNGRVAFGPIPLGPAPRLVLR